VGRDGAGRVRLLGADHDGLPGCRGLAAANDLPAGVCRDGGLLVQRPHAGDLLFTPGSDGTAEDPGHVGMYVGQGLVIQAPQTGEDIEITPFKGYWQQNVVAVRRVV
jgi:NlpC/P60 family